MWSFFDSHKVLHKPISGGLVNFPGTTNTSKFEIYSLKFRDATLWNTIPNKFKTFKDGT